MGSAFLLSQALLLDMCLQGGRTRRERVEESLALHGLVRGVHEGGGSFGRQTGAGALGDVGGGAARAPTACRCGRLDLSGGAGWWVRSWRDGG